jgi:hypothetical protein
MTAERPGGVRANATSASTTSATSRERVSTP